MVQTEGNRTWTQAMRWGGRDTSNKSTALAPDEYWDEKGPEFEMLWNIFNAVNLEVMALLTNNYGTVKTIFLAAPCMQDLNSLTRDQTCALHWEYRVFKKFFLLHGICFTILCWFLPYINISQPQVYICPLPPGPPCQLPPHPTLLCCHGALGWAPFVTQQIPTGYLV